MDSSQESSELLQSPSNRNSSLWLNELVLLEERDTGDDSVGSRESRHPGPQQLRERQKLENTAVEQMDSSQESSELLQSPSNRNSSLWLNELVLLGERDTGDDSVGSRESRHPALLWTFHHLLSQVRLGGRGLSLTAGEAAAGLGGAIGEGGGPITDVGGPDGDMGLAAVEEGGVREEIDAEFPQVMDDSTERADGMTLDLPGHAPRHGYHGNEAGQELGL
ncbi:uncharacterized protein [Enoplosus armatus]|uniref:uncharacterized protein isoform X2 n=1 Tax=Enoplosus armatus TaxID=215367 RepID=UPI003995A99A